MANGHPEDANATQTGSGAGHHDHSPRGDPFALAIALALTVLMMAGEFVASFFTHSLALLADAWHMVSDVGSLALALVATLVALRPRSLKKTFGYQRFEVLAALVNGVLLAAASVLIIVEAYQRFVHPPAVLGGWMVVTGFATMAVNLVIALFLSKRGGKNVNVRAALAHVLGDAAGAGAAIVAGAVVALTGENRADPVLSVAVSALLLWSAWRLVSETTHILMEGTPEGLRPDEIALAIQEVPGVQSVHDLHVWSISAGEPAVTAHVVLAPGGFHGVVVARAVCEMLEKRFGVAHSTVQPEPLPPGIVQLGRPDSPSR